MERRMLVSVGASEHQLSSRGEGERERHCTCMAMVDSTCCLDSGKVASFTRRVSRMMEKPYEYGTLAFSSPESRNCDVRPAEERESALRCKRVEVGRGLWAGDVLVYVVREGGGGRGRMSQA